MTSQVSLDALDETEDCSWGDDVNTNSVASERTHTGDRPNHVLPFC